MRIEQIVNTIEAVLGLCFAVGLVGWVIYFYLAQPMLRNYAECGTVFLCSAQPR